MLIWDLEKIPPRTGALVILWSQNSRDKNCISIVEYVENYSDEIRAKYLKWIYQLGEYVVNEKKIIDHLLIRKNLSYWWLTSLAQKVNIDASQNINDSIKLIGLEKLIKINCPKKIEIASNNCDLISIIENLCEVNNITFKKIDSKIKFKKSIESPFTSIHAIAYLFWYFLRTIPILLSVNKSRFKYNIIFIDIFTHIYSSTYKNYQFKSYYWEDLVDKLKEWNVRSNWAHIYYKNKKNRSFLRVKNLCNFLTLNSSGTQEHILLESSLNFKVFHNAIKDYIKIRNKTKLLFQLKNKKPERSNLDLWVLHKENLIDSLSGKNLIKNCLYINLFEKFMEEMPRQKLGIYISENQPWELALISAWRTSGHGTLIATPHNTLRYWDLRHHFYPKSYKSLNLGKYPMPNLVAVNSPDAFKNLVDSGYPSNKLIKVEALRYLYLLKGISNPKKIGFKHILICADYQKNNTIKILNWLSEIKGCILGNIIITYRPHPIYKLNINGYNNLKINISNNDLLFDLSSSDVVITGLISSVAADAYSLGLPIIQILDGTTINLSPLRSTKGVYFVGSKSEMLEILNRSNLKSNKRNDYFNLSQDLNLWKNILTNSPPTVYD